MSVRSRQRERIKTGQYAAVTAGRYKKTDSAHYRIHNHAEIIEGDSREIGHQKRSGTVCVRRTQRPGQIVKRGGVEYIVSKRFELLKIHEHKGNRVIVKWHGEFKTLEVG